jgi:hypothetical protein
MTVTIDRYVTADLNRLTGIIGQGAEKFNIVTLLGEHTNTAERVVSFSNPNEMVATGSLFATTDNLYLKALALYSQTKKPTKFKVAKKNTNANATQTIKFSATPDAGAFTVKLGANSSSSINFNDLLAAIETAIEATTGITSVTATGAIDATTGLTIVFDGADANTPFATLTEGANTLTSGGSPVTITIITTVHGSAVETWTQATTNLINEDSEFYFLAADTVTEADILEIAAVVNANKFVYVTTQNDANVLTATAGNTAEDLKNLSYKKTGFIWANTAANHADASFLGIGAPEKPGTLTYEIKKVSGVIAGSDSNATPFTTTQVTNLDAQNVIYVETLGGGASIINAKMVNGDFFDIQRLEDKIVFDVTNSVFSRIQNAKKIPQTQTGIDIIEQAIRTPLDQLVIDGAIKSDFAIVMPAIDSVSAADLSGRILRNVTINVSGTGAFHTVNMTINFSV